jgi:hypothetical protein
MRVSRAQRRSIRLCSGEYFGALSIRFAAINRNSRESVETIRASLQSSAIRSGNADAAPSSRSF